MFSLLVLADYMILIKEFYIDKIDKKFLYTIINIKSENFVDIIKFTFKRAIIIFM